MKKLFLFFLLLTFLYSCKEDCPEEIDPCDVYPSEFNIITSQEKRTPCTGDPKVEFGDYEEYFYDTFAITPALRIQFKTNFEFDSVKWQLGDDLTIYAQSQPIIDFSRPSQEVQVTCIGWRKVNSECFGINDDGVDTITKKISIFHIDDAPIFGTFKGTNEGENDSFMVHLGRDTLQDDIIGEYYLNFFQGLPKYSTYKIKNLEYKWFTCQGTSSNGHITPDGLSVCHINATLNRQNQDIISISWMTNNEIPRTFRGIRIK